MIKKIQQVKIAIVVSLFNFGTDVLNNIFNPIGRVVVNYNGKTRKPVFDSLIKVKKEGKIVSSFLLHEAFQLHSAVISTRKIKGDIAEVGTYKGGSARIICEAKGKKKLHLFDTFEGLPKVDRIDRLFKKGEFAGSLAETKKYLKGFLHVFYYQGVFPETGMAIKDTVFSLVHLDVDIYSSTKDALEFFYPRMSKGGIIISHDYINAAGVMKAFNEFFENKPEPLIELAGSQVLIVKV